MNPGGSSEARSLLRRLAANDELSGQIVLAARPELVDEDNGLSTLLLDRRIRALVILAALLVVDAATDSLRWALDYAAASGVDDEAILAALAVAGSAAGEAQLVASAPRLALAMRAR
jgi:alkylhydroperoxidase/carboxymuconolactone decarboxylase family protein YurZ